MLHPVKLAFGSRMVCLIVQVVFTQIGSKYDSSSVYQGFLSHTFKESKISGEKQIHANKTWLDHYTLKYLDGFGNWDSLYFLHISEFGYEYEQMMAFFPVFPLSVSLIAKTLCAVSFNAIGKLAALYLASSILNILAFSLASYFLYKLTLCITKNSKFANITILLFCLNPANVFTMAAYTESMYICFQFTAMYALESSKHSWRFLIASFLFAFGAGTRSNGILSAGFIICAVMQEILKSSIVINSKSLSWKMRNNVQFAKWITVLLTWFIGFLILVSLFILFQIYGYNMYCFNIERTAQFEDHWCFKTFPLSYSYIQKFYWNVGPFRYYELKQIPNFVLASPTILMSYCAVWSFFSNDGGFRMLLQYLDLWDYQPKRLSSSHGVNVYPNAKMFPYICHLLFLVTFGVINVHIQVMTRMLFSSSPILYWYAASLFSSEGGQQLHLWSKSGMVLVFFVFYTLLGLLMHCNFYPWT